MLNNKSCFSLTFWGAGVYVTDEFKLQRRLREHIQGGFAATGRVMQKTAGGGRRMTVTRIAWVVALALSVGMVAAAGRVQASCCACLGTCGFCEDGVSSGACNTLCS